jgi:hypothetical protein
MIRTRAAFSAGVAVLGLVVLLGPRTADPAAAVAAERLVREHAAAALGALDELRASVVPGLDAARAAAAAVLSADEPPGVRIEEAAAVIAGAEEAVVPTRRAVASLNGSLAARRPNAAPMPEPIAAGELSSIAGQLRASASAADRFADLRMRGTGLPGILEEALRALDRGALDDAAALTARARADHDTIVAWEAGPVTLPVWIETTDAMISAVEQIVDATRLGDAAAATEAARAFAALDDDAATADRALRIALSEGGSALTAVPLERLAAAFAAIEGSRAEVAAVVAAADR